MYLNEAKHYLKNKGYKLIKESSMKDGNDWYNELKFELDVGNYSEKEFKFVDSCFDDDYEELILKDGFIFWNDNWQSYADADGNGGDLYELAPLDDINYDDLVSEFGTPTEYIEKCLKYMK